ncbi:FAD-dependent monooxygenase [Nonomuraea sp. SMC257]|uniref:FAD-dependent monooxygenase n=1 Tax=Nonomuraea montanisoli TaxID=2741721 RepID=A0A7Y6M247_9ACTN|nr:FAD-dependent oxidoreductase [Nonomuraea montanisoli]NUW31802.1 FAD-dependent monooxygenase [Nonomuraea montanisoli]
MRALICGAGIAGLTLAWHLERAGWRVEVVERAPAFRDGGYMIDFYGPGQEVAARMGLAGRLEEARHPIDELSYLDRHGRVTSRLTTPPAFRSVVSLLRGDLARIIHDDTAAPIRYGTSVAGVEQDGGSVTVTLTDGTTTEVDLLVGADGAHSRVRDLAFGDGAASLRYLGHHVAAYLIGDAGLSREVGRRYRMLTVPGLMAGAYALGDDRLALLFLRREPDPALPADPAAALREHYGRLGWILPGALRAIPDDLYYDQVTQVVVDRWSAGRVVLLGDACQAVSLFAGHGASMAMAAAWVLADELSRTTAPAGTTRPAGATGATGDGVPAALARYEARMRPVIEDVQAFGRRFVEWMAPSSGLRITARDWLIRLAGLPGADRLFLRSMSPSGHRLVTGGPGRPVADRL